MNVAMLMGCWLCLLACECGHVNGVFAMYTGT